MGEESNVDARSASRTYDVFDHESDGLQGLVTISGGKLTTCRLMGEQIADLTAKKLGIREASRTKEVQLVGSGVDEETRRRLEGTTIEQSLIRRVLGTVGTIDEERYMPAIRLLMSYALSEE